MVTLSCSAADASRSRIPPGGVPNDPYSPRRGESAKQRARDRGGIGLLGTISGNIGSRFIV